MSLTFALGIFYAILCGAMNAIGVLCQKKAVNRIVGRGAAAPFFSSLLRSPLWLTGLFINVVLFVFVALPALAPVLMHYGYAGPADLIYTGYKLTCHQLAFRTYFFFGEQPVYTIDQLRASLGVRGEDALYWSSFMGNAQLGYKMAWCERDTAIYASIIIAGLAFSLVRERLHPLDWRLYLAFITPMAIDGFWQLFTSPLYILPFLPEHESTWLLRTITGALFGTGSVWLIYPYLQDAMKDVNTQAKDQLRRALAHQDAPVRTAGESVRGREPLDR